MYVQSTGVQSVLGRKVAARRPPTSSSLYVCVTPGWHVHSCTPSVQCYRAHTRTRII